jgi:hypothetical protein
MLADFGLESAMRHWQIGKALLLLGVLGEGAGIGVAAGVLEVNTRSLVSRADLNYDEPARRSEEGMPVGNGRMGSLVWTTPTALRFQINHANVYGINCETDSYFVRHTDYASTCAYLDIGLADYGEDVFTAGMFKQHLSLYDGLMTLRGKGVSVQVLAWPTRDCFAVEIEDTRANPQPIGIDLRMLRYMTEYNERHSAVDPGPWQMTQNHEVMFRTGSHTALSGLVIREGRIGLTQKFREDGFYGASAVTVGIVGRPAQARYLNEATVRLAAAPGQGKFLVLIGSAASFDSKEDIAASALAALEAAQARGSFAALQADTTQWWHDFWSKGFVHMHSDSGQADFVETNYTYFLYLMNASSHGDYPPRFGGMIWYTNGDMRAWGSQHWWANTNAYYRNLMPSGRLDLLDPMFNMYFKMYDSCARAAVQQWGSKGIWIPETVWFDGLDNLPDDIAAEMRDLYLARKPWDQASAQFLEWARTKQPHHSRVSWKDKGQWVNGRFIYKDKGRGPFGHTSHILGAGTRIAELFWQRYQYTLDQQWLRERAYPMIKGSAEFYRNFPNFQKGDDGKYHIHHVNNSESQWNSSDTAYEVGAMRTIFPLAVRAADILGVDADLRPVWKEIADNLVAEPVAGRRGGSGTPSTQNAPAQRPGGGAFAAFTAGGDGGIEPIGPEPEIKARFLGFNRLGGFIDTAGSGGAQIFRNRLRLREGPGAIDAEHLGGLTSGIHSALCSSAPPAGTEGDPIIQVFSVWPKDWDCEFSLLARGAFVISSAHREGKIAFVEIQSQAGSPCRLMNPWAGQVVTLYRNGKKAEDLSGEVLMFPTQKGQTIVALPKGQTPPTLKVL